MSDEVRIQSPISVKNDCRERVAFDLAMAITSYDDINVQQKNRKYWLDLYVDCLQAVCGHRYKG